MRPAFTARTARVSREFPAGNSHSERSERSSIPFVGSSPSRSSNRSGNGDAECRIPSHTTMSAPSSSPSSIQKIQAGDGRIVVEFDSYRGHTFTRLSCTYPLKLLSPRSNEDSVAIVYVLSYGGGFVGGDEVELEVGVREGASLMLLSQV